MTYAIVRKDLRQDAIFPPIWNGSFEITHSERFWVSHSLYHVFECCQPERMDWREQNLILIDGDGQLYYGQSIDFDFYETIEQAIEEI